MNGLYQFAESLNASLMTYRAVHRTRISRANLLQHFAGKPRLAYLPQVYRPFTVCTSKAGRMTESQCTIPYIGYPRTAGIPLRSPGHESSSRANHPNIRQKVRKKKRV